MRALLSLPVGVRTIEPRSLAGGLIWFGASEWGVRRGSIASQPACDRLSLPPFSQNRFLPALLNDMLVCMPLPLMPVTGLGRNDAVMPRFAATCRHRSLYSCTWAAGV